jgi:ubiquinone biosynthesis protein
MNALQLARLMRTIYSPAGPDLRLIQSMGLLAIKIGQTYALRFDFIPEENCRRLSSLYQHVDAVMPEQIESVLAGSYGRGWHDLLPFIDRVPLASASVGQVHRARLRDGTPVVVKVIKGDFAPTFRRDVASVRRVLQVAVFFYPKLERVADPVGIIDSIEQSTLAELDLTVEAQGQQILRDIQQDYRGQFDLERLRFPRIYTELARPQVLVSEELTGKTFEDLLREGKLDYFTLLDLYRLHGFFMFRVGTFHGDLHPGNIVLQDGHIYLLDTGAIGHVTPRLSEGLLRFFEALGEYQYDDAAAALNGMAERAIEGVAYDRFRDAFIELYRDFRGANVATVSLTKRMMQTIKLGVHSGMRFEQGMYPVIKSLMYLDGMVLRCNPQAQPIRDMRPMIDSLKRPQVAQASQSSGRVAPISMYSTR